MILSSVNFRGYDGPFILRQSSRRVKLIVHRHVQGGSNMTGLYLQDYTKMRGQQTMKFKENTFHFPFKDQTLKTVDKNSHRSLG